MLSAMLALLGETTVADVAACVVARQMINGISGGRIASPGPPMGRVGGGAPGWGGRRAPRGAIGAPLRGGQCADAGAAGLVGLAVPVAP